MHSPTSTMPVNPVMFSGNLQFLALRSLKKKASCINTMLRFLILTSNKEGSSFLVYKSYILLDKWLTFVEPLYFPVEEGRSYE